MEVCELSVKANQGLGLISGQDLPLLHEDISVHIYLGTMMSIWRVLQEAAHVHFSGWMTQKITKPFFRSERKGPPDHAFHSGRSLATTGGSS